MQHAKWIRKAGLWLAVTLCSANFSALAITPTSPTDGVAAAAHLRAAERQASGDVTLKVAFRRGCSIASGPKTAILALQQLQQAEADYQAERALPRPRGEQLLEAVVARGCAAFHATRLQQGVSYPVWLYTRIQIEGIRPAPKGFEIQARATNVEGAVVSSRMTFARGLHHACFVPTDASGDARCVMVDTHPHGGMASGWAEAHEGPFVATLAGSVSANRIELPAVAFLDLPVFSGPSSFR